MEPIPDLMFSSIEKHALPALSDGFSREYKKEWLESFCKHVAQYDETLGESRLKPLSEVFTEEQLRSIPVHNKAGENYFGHMSEQLRSKGGSVFKAISDHLAQVKLRSCIWKGCCQHVEGQEIEVKTTRNQQN